MAGTEKEWNEWAERRLPKWDTDHLTAKLPNSYDEVQKPRHYNSGKVECIEAIEASMSPEEFKGYLKGNTLKYLWRYSYKGKPVQDLEKAQWYLEKLKTVQ